MKFCQINNSISNCLYSKFRKKSLRTDIKDVITTTDMIGIISKNIREKTNIARRIRHGSEGMIKMINSWDH